MPTPRKTAEQHWLTGTESQAKESAPAQFERGSPKMPDDLTESGKKEYRRLVRELKRRGTLTRVDGSSLELYIRTWETWRAAHAEVQANGVMVETAVTDSRGDVHIVRKQNPATKIAAACAATLRQMLREFGATPKAREGVKPAKPKAEDEPYPINSLGWLRQQRAKESSNEVN
jgi:P27 family predicted phage terminase small subunit